METPRRRRTRAHRHLRRLRRAAHRSVDVSRCRRHGSRQLLASLVARSGRHTRRHLRHLMGRDHYLDRRRDRSALRLRHPDLWLRCARSHSQPIRPRAQRSRALSRSLGTLAPPASRHHAAALAHRSARRPFSPRRATGQLPRRPWPAPGFSSVRPEARPCSRLESARQLRVRASCRRNRPPLGARGVAGIPRRHRARRIRNHPPSKRGDPRFQTRRRLGETPGSTRNRFRPHHRLRLHPDRHHRLLFQPRCRRTHAQLRTPNHQSRRSASRDSRLTRLQLGPRPA